LDNDLIIQAACGDAHTAMVSQAGNLWVCGAGAKGRLGLDTSDNALLPAKLPAHFFGGSCVGRGRVLSRDHVLALCMCVHPRLGAQSPAATLLPDVLRRIVALAQCCPPLFWAGGGTDSDGTPRDYAGVLRILGGGGREGGGGIWV